MARPRVRGFWFVLVAAGGLAGSLPAVADAASTGRNGRIAYVQMRSTWLNSFAGTTVYSIAPSGTRRRAIVHLGEAAGATAAFSPRGGWIAYASTYAEPLGGLFLMRANGRDRRRLTPAPSTDTLLFTDATPAFAPDGKRIAFSRTYWTGPSSGTGVRIYDRGRSRLLVTDAYDPSWSVRNRIAFTRGHGRIWTIRPDGTGLHKIVGRGREPDWSPDGLRIVYEFDSTIWIALADGSHVRRVHRGFSPVFSPDGRRIAFIGRFNSLYTMSVRGRHIRRLASPGEDASLFSPAWQPRPPD